MSAKYNTMEYREAHVLKGLIDAYVATGRPVGSSQLVESMKLPVSPATVRNILRFLEDDGFVAQPHTSAGRVPTDKGYRYYVSHLVFRQPSQNQRERLSGQYEELQGVYARPSQAAAKTLARAAHLLALSCWTSSRDVHGAGISDFLGALTREEAAAAGEAARLVDDAEEYIVEGFGQQGTPEVQVYVGDENPVFPSHDLSMLVRSIESSDGEHVVLVLVGPKRMPYKRSAALLNSMASVLESTV